jgi:hypothetical protein
LFAIHQGDKKKLGVDGHWFTIAIDMETKKFQVIDSLRTPNSIYLIDNTNEVRTKVIKLWDEYTSKHMGCTVSTISTFELEFITGLKQFGM